MSERTSMEVDIVDRGTSLPLQAIGNPLADGRVAGAEIALW